MAQPGIAVASCGDDDGAPRLIDPPGRHWSRQAALDWIAAESATGDLLVGLDLGMAFAFADQGAYFPGWAETPPDARALWALVDRICGDEPNLAAATFVDHPAASRHFRRHGGRLGDLFGTGIGRLRVTEIESRRQGVANPVSNANLIGAAQVGKASLTGMRMLHRLGTRIAVWPFDPLPRAGSVIVEIYTSIAARAAGLPRGRTKIRDPEMLATALARLGSAAPAHLRRVDDHAMDALLAAAWLRAVSADAALWSPAALTPALARTEGWTFGVA